MQVTRKMRLPWPDPGGINLESGRITLITRYILLCIFLLLFFGTVFAQSDVFQDTENCLMCHRYPALGKFDKVGKKRIFYVNGNRYWASVHGKLKCTGCHIGLDKIPHADVNRVDCSTECHIEASSGRRNFSHSDVVGKYEASVHGRGTEKPEQFPEDLPTCTYCHTNRDYKLTEKIMGRSSALSDKEMTALRHPTSNLRSQEMVVKLCASCHEDREKMARHGLESIKTYKDTFHWSLLKYGVADAPDCISCHVPMGYSAHTIRPGEDSISPIHTANRVKTCSNSGGIQICHPNATEGFATGRVHTYGIKAQIVSGEGGFKVEGGGKSLMETQARADITEAEVRHYRIIRPLKLIYKYLIGCVIGFMSLHQLLDYIRARKKHKISH
jgi:hypothetical protein